MEQDGHLKNLTERMKEKAEQERIQTENVYKEQLQTLRDNLLASSQNALRTMSDAMEREITDAATMLSQHYRTLSLAYGRAWMRTAITAFAMLLGLTAGGWALMKVAAYRLDAHRQELAQVKAEHANTSRTVEILDKTLQTLLDETSGVTIMNWNGSRYVIGPPNSENGHTIQGRPAIKLEK